MTQKELIKSFNKIFSADQILTDKSELEFYGKDVSKQFVAKPSLILLPKTVDQISAALKVCSKKKIRVVPSGGRTGYSGGATAQKGEVVISLSKMNRVLEINNSDATVRCEAGITTEALKNKVAEQGFFYPVDFTSKGSSQIGGNIATNAGGIRVIRYGNTREWVLGLKVVLANGEILNLNGDLWKNQTGYDFRHLFIGSEGTLGIIAEATLKLTTPPKESSLCLCGANKAQEALTVLEKIRKEGLTVNVFEYFVRSGMELVLNHRPLKDPFIKTHPVYFLVEVEATSNADREKFENILEKLIDSELLNDVVFGQSEKHRLDLMALRELIGEVANQHYVPHKNDISVPIPKIPEFITALNDIYSKRFPEYKNIIFGHVGDGNLHVNVIKPDNLSPDKFFKSCEKIDLALFQVVKEFHGSISAEHGVGLLKKPYLKYSRSQTEIDLMKKIKRSFDPAGILNPGKIF